jgi:hypothetical protein
MGLIPTWLQVSRLTFKIIVISCLLIFVQTILPRPATDSNQRLSIRRSDLFGPALVPGRNGSDILYLDVEQLRHHATRALGSMNLIAA